MDEKATKITAETSDGKKAVFVTYKDMTLFQALVDKMIKRDLADQIRDVINFELHESDVFVATYPKAGTHWAWEVVCMLLQGTSDYIKTDKETLFMDMVNPDKIAKIPSPRVLNCHYTPRCTPREIVEKGVKIVHVQRNAKDVLVSMYNHIKTMKMPLAESFDTFFKLFTGSFGVYPNCSWAHYVKEWENFSKQHPQQILNVCYEDMKEDPVREIEKINTFLQCNRSGDLVRDIADACSFNKLKEANKDKQHTVKNSDFIYRKGEVGDWKNWLTVAQNEQMDQWLEENFTNTNLTFRYTI